MEKADSRESPAVTHEIKAQVKMPVANNTMNVTRDSAANIGVEQTEVPKDCHSKQEVELTLPMGGDMNSVGKKVAKMDQG